MQTVDGVGRVDGIRVSVVTVRAARTVQVSWGQRCEGHG